jgi:hypothetical protein
MGNQQSSHSRATTPTSNPQSPSSVTTASHAQKERPSHPHIPHLHHAARRRESIPALSTVKSQAAPPSASFTNAESHPTSTSTRPPSRGRSHTVATAASAVIASNLRAAQDSYKSASHDTMGNEQSKGQAKEKGHLARDSTPPQLQPATSTPEKAQEQPPAEPEPAPAHALAHAPSPQTKPVDVPVVPREEPQSSRPDDPASSIDPADASQQEYVVSPSHFSRPPRLPLPIEEETHVPGSPILSSHDYTQNYSPIDHDEVEGTLPRHASIISNTTNADDEDLGEEFKGPNTARPTVPTLIEWEGEGERVYATGTFAGWNRKYRLHKK